MTIHKPFKPRPYLMKNQIQHYAWGTKAEAAFIPRFLGLEPDPDLPYAELWMGAHPKAPSEILMGDVYVSLSDLVVHFPTEVLGNEVREAFAGAWPFLFKVLSIAAPLSIQAHPNKMQAEQLHARDPEHYLDDNHKPEVAIALDALTALVGFKSFKDIDAVLNTYPEIADFIGCDTIDTLGTASTVSSEEQSQWVRALYTALMHRSISEPEMLGCAIERLAERLRCSSGLSKQETLFLDLRKTYTGIEVGLFALFFLNLVHLEKGQGIFLKAGIPHAYVKGNLIECMANSDNVVRAGLTPKFKDVETLIDILTYELDPVQILGSAMDAKTIVYSTPVPDFQLRRWTFTPGEERTEVPDNHPKIVLVTHGEAKLRWLEDAQFYVMHIQRGQSVFIPAALQRFEVIAKTDMEIFVAGVPHS